MKIKGFSYYIIFIFILIFILNKNNHNFLLLFLNSRYTDLHSLFNKPNSQINICSSLQQKLTNLVGKNNDNIAITILDSYHNIISDINFSKTIGNFEITLNISNLFNHRYELIQNYTMPGRNGYISITKILNKDKKQ